MLAQGVSSDPFRLFDGPIGYANTTPSSVGRTLVSPYLVGGELTWVIVTAGQSLVCNYASGTYTKTSTKIHQLNLLNGGVYEAADPTLGVDGTQTNFAVRLADKLITAGKCQRVIFLPIGVGGSDIAQWGLGGAYNHRIGVAFRRLASIGLTPTMFLWQQGTSDNSLGTTQATYTARGNEMISTVRANAAVNLPIFIAKESWVSGVLSTPVRAAQTALVNPSSFIFVGPDIDTITDRQDASHMNATGANLQAAAWQSAVSAIL